jgi:hypothetical protein
VGCAAVAAAAVVDPVVAEVQALALPVPPGLTLYPQKGP